MRHTSPRSTKRKLTAHDQRSLFVVIVFLLLLGGGYWAFLSDGLPIWWGPTANASEIATGRDLFEHQWQPNDPLAHGDGLGPVFNAKSCASCHFQGGLGGGGGAEHNAVAFEVTVGGQAPHFITGAIHSASVEASQHESKELLRKMYPIVPGSTRQVGTPGCFSTEVIPPFDPVRTQTLQPTALFGAGWVNLISDKAILRSARDRTIQGAVDEIRAKNLDAQSIPVGRVRQTAAGVGKFGWKAQFATLDEFVAQACANELGLGTPAVKQAKPIAGPGQEVSPDLDARQFRSLVSFVKTLPKPVEVVPDQPAARESAANGMQLFNSIGCAVCHVPDMGGVKGVYTDFLLYVLDDPMTGSNYTPSSPQPLPERPESDAKPEEWKTPALWGVADSAPYFHDGGSPTLKDAILRHRGDARTVNDKYKKLSESDQAAVIAFLLTLKAPPDAPQLRDPSVTKLAGR